MTKYSAMITLSLCTVSFLFSVRLRVIFLRTGLSSQMLRLSLWRFRDLSMSLCCRQRIFVIVTRRRSLPYGSIRAGSCGLGSIRFAICPKRWWKRSKFYGGIHKVVQLHWEEVCTMQQVLHYLSHRFNFDWWRYCRQWWKCNTICHLLILWRKLLTGYLGVV